MASKRLTVPPANFNYGSGNRQNTEKKAVPKTSFPHMKRPGHTDSSLQPEWAADLPAYDFKVKSGKKMELPKADDSLLGGFSNLRAGKMTASTAKVYMEQKKKEKAKEEARKDRIREAYDPFAGLVGNTEEDEFL